MPALNQKQPQQRNLAFLAKAETFSFKFRIPHPPSTLGRFSIDFKFLHCRLKLKSVTSKRHRLRSKFFGILRKFPSLLKSRSPVILKPPTVRYMQYQSEVPVFFVSSIISEIFSPGLCEGTQNGAIVCMSVLLQFVKMTFKKFISQRLNQLLLLILVSILSCWALFCLHWHLDYFDDCALFIASGVWSNAASSIGSNPIYKAFLSRISAWMGLTESFQLQFF